MKIGELAQRAGVGIDTVRYYERQGLLPLPMRQLSGYRRFEAKDIARLQFVRRAKTLGFTLAEIRELLALSDQRGGDMATVKATTTQKLADVESKIAELKRIRNGLRMLLDSCPGHGAVECCPILNALEGEEQMNAHSMHTGHPHGAEGQTEAPAEATCCSATRACQGGAQSAASANDPVCGMAVDPATTPHHATRAGVDYYFCSSACQQEFID